MKSEARGPLALLLLALPGTASAGDYGIDPAVNVLTLGEGETFSEVITVTVPADAASAQADIYLLADVTGSMGLPITAVRVAAAAIIDSLEMALPDTELCFGAGWYRDFPYDVPPFQHQVGPGDGGCAVHADVDDAISDWYASGGSDGPEAQLYALDRLANDPAIDWRDGAEKIVVWFGDAPGHDNICTSLTGLGYDITEAGVTEDLIAADVTVLAISTNTGYDPAGLDGNPASYNYDYDGAYVLDPCPQVGVSGQGTRIAEATGGNLTAGVDDSVIAGQIMELVEAAVTSVGNLRLVANGASALYVTDISPEEGYGPIDTTTSSEWMFDVEFTGVCFADGPQTLEGTIDALADGGVVASKTVSLTLPGCNEPPVAVCADVEVVADEDCLGCASVDGGSFDPDGDDVTIEELPTCDYELGTTEVQLTVTDPSGASDTCVGWVTVVDETPPTIDCNTMATITPPMAPISFTATTDDNCGADVEIVDYFCWGYTGSGKVHSKMASCWVRMDGDTLTIVDSGGVGDHIDWTVEATDDAGNTTTATCSTVVVNPRGKK